MSYGLTFTNNSNLVVIDSEFARLNVICSGRYAPTQESGMGSTTSFPRTITSQEPPLVFCRPDSGGIAGLTEMQVIGSAGNWTGFYVRAYDVNTNQPNGRYFAATFGAQPVASYGMRLWDGSSKLLVDTGTPNALFTRAFQNWSYVRYETTGTTSTRIFYSVPFNFPENEYLLINNFGMNMVTGAASGRILKTLWDFNAGILYAVTDGFSNPFAFFLPALFAKLSV
ncbi:hypothetical protein LJR159_000979 [Pseudomonas brassicacearum]|uniref:hypothetical protein n=1 Tax=Pseudomonas brassicacearum TaxID=930166 RepID=UPI003ED0C85A